MKEINMKKTFHLCLSAGNEAMFRDEQDYIHGFNSFAIALAKTGSTGLADAFMCNHCHLIVQTDDHRTLMRTFRTSYSHYFNQKYERQGKLGEDIHFCTEIEGYHHILTAACYVLRNPLHHGIAPTPFGYEHCSANSIYKKELGKSFQEKIIDSRHHYKHIGRRFTLPAQYKMNERGLITRESVLDIPQMENMFVSPRSYCFMMTRKSSEEWLKEQEKDNNCMPAITLEKIESGVEAGTVKQMLFHENGRNGYKKKSDIELCTEIDKHVREKLFKKSVYQLTLQEKHKIAEFYINNHHISDKQLRRCLAIE